MSITYQFEEGCACPECQGSMEYPPVENCSCHNCPPCSACVNNRLKCEDCGFEEPEPPPPPPPTQEQKDAWAEESRQLEEARMKGHTLPGGGRIFDIRHDGSSGSTMEFSGRCEGPVTAKEIFECLGDGTFGHRGPTIHGDRFTYTKITD